MTWFCGSTISFCRFSASWCTARRRPFCLSTEISFPERVTVSMGLMFSSVPTAAVVLEMRPPRLR